MAEEIDIVSILRSAEGAPHEWEMLQAAKEIEHNRRRKQGFIAGEYTPEELDNDNPFTQWMTTKGEDNDNS